MNGKKVLVMWVLALMLLGLLAACDGFREAEPTPVGLPNPASVYCEEQGGTLEMREGEGGTYGVCRFDDGSECEEWAYFRGECAPGMYDRAEDGMENGE